MQTLVVYVTRSGAKVPMCIDTVVEQSGVRVGKYSGRTIDAIMAANPGAVIGPIEDYIALHDKAWETTPAQISAEDFKAALDALPPCNWRRLGGFECFAFMECVSGSMTTIYARVRDVYWSFVGHKSLTAGEIMERIEMATRDELVRLVKQEVTQ